MSEIEMSEILNDSPLLGADRLFTSYYSDPSGWSNWVEGKEITDAIGVEFETLDYHEGQGLGNVDETLKLYGDGFILFNEYSLTGNLDFDDYFILEVKNGVINRVWKITGGDPVATFNNFIANHR